MVDTLYYQGTFRSTSMPTLSWLFYDRPNIYYTLSTLNHTFKHLSSVILRNNEIFCQVLFLNHISGLEPA